MIATLKPDTARETLVGMGQVILGRGPNRLKAIVGSCVGTALYSPTKRLGLMAHVVLPDSSGREALPGKFADTAIPYMLRLLESEHVGRGGLVAKIAGGADMFGHSGPLRIGQNNIQAVVQALKQIGIPLVAQDVGGSAGRRIEFDCATGSLTIEVVGKAPQVL